MPTRLVGLQDSVPLRSGAKCVASLVVTSLAKIGNYRFWDEDKREILGEKIAARRGPTSADVVTGPDYGMKIHERR